MFAFQFLHLSTDNFSICFKPFSTCLIGWLAEIEMREKEKKKTDSYRESKESLHGKGGSNHALSVFPGVVAAVCTGRSRLVKACAVTWLVQHGVLGQTQGEGKPPGTQERESAEQRSIRSCRLEIHRLYVAVILFVKLLLGVIASQEDWLTESNRSCWRPSGPSLITENHESCWGFVFSASCDRYPMAFAGNLLWCFTNLSLGVFPNVKTKSFLLKFNLITA